MVQTDFQLMSDCSLILIILGALLQVYLIYHSLIIPVNHRKDKKHTREEALHTVRMVRLHVTKEQEHGPNWNPIDEFKKLPPERQDREMDDLRQSLAKLKSATDRLDRIRRYKVAHYSDTKLAQIN